MRIAAIALAAVLAGCSSVPAYRGIGPANLDIATTIDSGERLTSTKVALDVHRVDRRCETQHLGRVYIDDAAMRIGIPEERLLLDFIFVSKATFSGNAETRYRTMLTARPGYEYRAQVSYDKGIYGVQLREARKGSSPGRVLDMAPLSGCRPA